jgi:hypothetical protein
VRIEAYRKSTEGQITSFAETVIMQSSSGPEVELSTLIKAPDSCLICLMTPPPFPITPPTLAGAQSKRKLNSFAELSSLRGWYIEGQSPATSPLYPPYGGITGVIPPTGAV